MATKKKDETQDPGVASDAENAKLEHTDDKRDQAEAAAPDAPVPFEIPEGVSATTRHDHTDVGVPMLPGDPDEPVGPEDALGPGPKRGDYRERIIGHPHEGGVPQRPRAEEIGDAEKEKGGVTTSSSS